MAASGPGQTSLGGGWRSRLKGMRRDSRRAEMAAADGDENRPADRHRERNRWRQGDGARQLDRDADRADILRGIAGIAAVRLQRSARRNHRHGMGARGQRMQVTERQDELEREGEQSRPPAASPRKPRPHHGRTRAAWKRIRIVIVGSRYFDRHREPESHPDGRTIPTETSPPGVLTLTMTLAGLLARGSPPNCRLPSFPVASWQPAHR